jgi:UDP-glucose 4-epimerase
MTTSNKISKTLVIGGSGFIGRHLIESLLAEGRDVRSLDITRPEQSGDRLEFIEGSFTDCPLMEEVLTGCDIVFHLASTTLPKTSNDDPLFDIKTNLSGTVALLDLAVKKNIKKFIFISSGGTVYGVPTQLPVSEDHNTNPLCSYGIVKLAIEKYLRMYHRVYGVDTCSLRLSNPYGEYQRVDAAQGAVSVFCNKALASETIEIWGDGSVVRDFIYVKDAVRAMLCAIEADCAGKEINIGYGSGVSLNQLLGQIETVCGHSLDKQYMPARGFDVPEIYLDIERAKKVLGWEPRVSLADGLELLAKWMKNGGTC